MNTPEDSYTLIPTIDGVQVLCDDGVLLPAEANDIDDYNYEHLDKIYLFKCWNTDAEAMIGALSEAAYDLGVSRHFKFPVDEEYNGLDPDRFYEEMAGQEEYAQEMRANCGVSQYGSVLPI